MSLVYRFEHSLGLILCVFQVKLSFCNKDWLRCSYKPQNLYDLKNYINFSDIQYYFFIIKPTRCTNFTNLFCHENLHVSDSSSVHHQEFIHRTPSNGIRAGPGWNPVPSWSCSKAVYKPVWHIPLLSVQCINSWWWTDELSETCRVSLQNKFVKLVHLVCFITKKFVMMHCRSHERKIQYYLIISWL
jgi:hypothetical protein